MLQILHCFSIAHAHDLLHARTLLFSCGGAEQVAFDVFIHLPFMYFPTFYTVKEFVQVRGASTP